MIICITYKVSSYKYNDIQYNVYLNFFGVKMSKLKSFH